jgi:hypothetical protein
LPPSQLPPPAQHICPDGQSALLLHSMREWPVGWSQVSPGPWQVNTAAVSEPVAQHCAMLPAEQVTLPHSAILGSQVLPLLHLNPGEHPSLVPLVHDEAQLLPEHGNPLQGWGMWAHAPLPSQWNASTAGGVPPQVWVPHVVPEARRRQELEVVPRPLQVPSLPQELLTSTEQSPSGFAPAETGLQDPFAAPVFALEQAMQSPVQAFSQQ